MLQAVKMFVMNQDGIKILPVSSQPQGICYSLDTELIIYVITALISYLPILSQSITDTCQLVCQIVMNSEVVTFYFYQESRLL